MAGTGQGRRRREPAPLRASLSRWVGLGVAVLVGIAGWLAVDSHRSGLDIDRLARDQQAVTTAANAVEAQMKQALAAAQTVEMLVRNTGSGAGFERLAAEIVERSPLVASIALAPAGVVTQVYPRERADADVGWRLLADPAIRNEAREAARQHQMVAGAPRPLPGGGVGVAALLPVVQAEGDKLPAGGLWGYVVIVVRAPHIAPLLADVGLPVGAAGFSLAHFSAESNTRVTFHPLPLPTLTAAVSAPIRLPQRSWTLSASTVPKSASRTWEAAVLAAAALAGLAAHQAMRLVRRARVRRTVFHHSATLAPWAGEFDGVHRQLERLRHRSGWAVILVVRMPTRPAGPAQPRTGTGALPSAWHPELRRLLRESDLLVPMRAREFLVAVHGIDSRVEATQICRRLHRQLHAVAQRELRNAEVVVSVASQLAELGRHDLDSVFAELLLQLQEGPPASVAVGAVQSRAENSTWANLAQWAASRRDAAPTEPMPAA